MPIKSTRKSPKRLARKSSLAKQAASERHLYVSLPSGLITEKMLEGRLVIDSVRMTMDLGSGGRHVVSILDQDPKVRLYALNQPLGQIQIDYVSHVNEILSLRNRLMLMAIRLGLADEVPSVTVHATWPQLADKILDAIGSPQSTLDLKGKRLANVRESKKLLNQIIGEAIGNILWTKNEIVAMGQKIFASRAKTNPPQG